MSDDDKSAERPRRLFNDDYTLTSEGSEYKGRFETFVRAEVERAAAEGIHLRDLELVLSWGAGMAVARAILLQRRDREEKR